jgi:plastocyanin
MTQSGITFSLLASLALLAVQAAPASAQRGRGRKVVSREIRLIHQHGEEAYRFEPAKLTVHPGDTLVFRVMGGPPHNIVIAADNLTPRARAAWNAALPGRVGDLSGPLLTTVGERYRVVVPAVPSGSYRYYCLSHRAYDETGVITVAEP